MSFDIPAAFEQILDSPNGKTGLLFQVIISLVGWVVAALCYNAIKRMAKLPSTPSKTVQILTKFTQPMIFPLGVCLIQWIIVAACREFHWGSSINVAIAKFSTAWLLVRFLMMLNFSKGIQRLLTVSIYTTTLLEILGLLTHLAKIMDTFALRIGDLHISLLSTVKGCSLFLLLLLGTARTSKWLGKTLKKSRHLDRSHQELFTKLTKVTFVTFSVLLSLSAAGINLSAFALLGGAIGVGIGFGLQKVVSNFICGIILLLDRSIKPGDIIAVSQEKSYGESAYGEIIELGARCVTVRTLAGKEYLIPNEEFIIAKAENWSHSDTYLRIKVPMRASLESDVELVLKLLLAAPKGVKRVRKDRPVDAMVVSFTDSAIEFELLVWINDPENGVKQLTSDLYVNIWKAFKEHNIKIPHAQTDLYIQSINATSRLQELLETQDASKENSADH